MEPTKRPASDGASNPGESTETSHVPTPPAKKVRLTKRQLRQDPLYQQFFKFRTELNRCSAASDCKGAVDVFRQLQQNPDVKCNVHMFGMMIALCAKAGDVANGQAIYSYMQEKGLQPNEVVYSSMVKLYGDSDDLENARATFDVFLAKVAGNEVELQNKKTKKTAKGPDSAAGDGGGKTRGASGGGRIKLRTLVPLFAAYSRVRNIDACQQLFQLMGDLELDPNEPIFRAMIDVFALACIDARVHGLTPEKATYFRDSMKFILRDMKDSILSIGHKTKNSLQRWFREACPGADGTPRPWEVGTCVPNDKGHCQESGFTLGRIHIRRSEYVTLASQIEKLVVRGSAKRERQWNAFKKFIAARSGKYDVFIDGANVGFYGQNKGGVCRINIPQIGVALEKWVELKRSPLIVMHKHHRLQNRQHEALFADWERRGLLYACEKGNNDDWYWLWAAVHTCNPDSVLISNDEMKDHHFNMLRPKYFQRWKIRHQTRFHFSWGSDGKRKIDFYLPAIFTRCIQSHHAGIKNTSASESSDGAELADSEVIAWHFPLRDPKPANGDQDNSERTTSAVKGSHHPPTSSSVGPTIRLRVGGVPAVHADAGGVQGATKWFFCKRVGIESSVLEDQH